VHRERGPRRRLYDLGWRKIKSQINSPKLKGDHAKGKNTWSNIDEEQVRLAGREENEKNKWPTCYGSFAKHKPSFALVPLGGNENVRKNQSSKCYAPPPRQPSVCHFDEVGLNYRWQFQIGEYR
jgi:hypothetical protein